MWTLKVPDADLRSDLCNIDLHISQTASTLINSCQERNIIQRITHRIAKVIMIDSSKDRSDTFLSAYKISTHNRVSDFSVSA